MSFVSGRVSFVRFRVDGDGPASVDQTTLATLAEHAFTERSVGAPDEIESGFTGGAHLLDTDFSYEKNGYGVAGDLLLFALRIDTNRVPSELRLAYRAIHERAIAKDNPSGFASKRQKKDAQELAERQAHDDLASGKFRRSKVVPLLWDFTHKTLYCGASSNVVIETLSSRMRECFNVDLTLLTAGGVANGLLREQSKARDFEDLRPSAFTPPPVAARREMDDSEDSKRDATIPPVPWALQAIEMKDFVGNEFLIWLWWMSETAEGMVDVVLNERKMSVAFVIDKALDMECAWGVSGKQTLRGDGPTRLAEAGDALLGGKWPRKMSLIVADAGKPMPSKRDAKGERESKDELDGDRNIGDEDASGDKSDAEGKASMGGGTPGQWELSLQGDRWLVSGAALPPVTEADSPRDIVEARLSSVRDLSATLDAMMAAFLKQRVGSRWSETRKAIREWNIKRIKR